MVREVSTLCGLKMNWRQNIDAIVNHVFFTSAQTSPISLVSIYSQLHTHLHIYTIKSLTHCGISINQAPMFTFIIGSTLLPSLSCIYFPLFSLYMFPAYFNFIQYPLLSGFEPCCQSESKIRAIVLVMIRK